MIAEFFKDLWQNHKRDIFEVLLLIVLFSWALISMNRCSNIKEERDNANNNIVALIDSVEYYTAKNGELVAQKTMLTGEISDLKLINEEMYNDLQSMKRKNAQLAAQINGYINNPQRDTVWKYSKDTLYVSQQLVQPFQFKDEFRNLSGNITLQENTMGLNITEDFVYFKYNIAVEDGLVYIMSDNPYVHYDKITAIQEPKKTKRWNIGFQIGIGFQYDMVNKNVGFGPYAGVGVSYGLNF